MVNSDECILLICSCSCCLQMISYFDYTPSSFPMTGKSNHFAVLHVCLQSLSSAKKVVPLTFTVILMNNTIFRHFSRFVISNLLNNSFILLYFIVHSFHIKMLLIYISARHRNRGEPATDCRSTAHKHASAM